MHKLKTNAQCLKIPHLCTKTGNQRGTVFPGNVISNSKVSHSLDVGEHDFSATSLSLISKRSFSRFQLSTIAKQPARRLNAASGRLPSILSPSRPAPSLEPLAPQLPGSPCTLAPRGAPPPARIPGRSSPACSWHARAAQAARQLPRGHGRRGTRKHWGQPRAPFSGPQIVTTEYSARHEDSSEVPKRPDPLPTLRSPNQETQLQSHAEVLPSSLHAGLRMRKSWPRPSPPTWAPPPRPNYHFSFY